MELSCFGGDVPRKRSATTQGLTGTEHGRYGHAWLGGVELGVGCARKGQRFVAVCRGRAVAPLRCASGRVVRRASSIVGLPPDEKPPLLRAPCDTLGVEISEGLTEALVVDPQAPTQFDARDR